MKDLNVYTDVYRRTFYFSESTLSSSSADIPLPRRQGVPLASSLFQPDVPKANSLTVETRQGQRPEDDILYQWRLARKMEQARQGSKAFSKVSSMNTKMYASNAGHVPKDRKYRVAIS